MRNVKDESVPAEIRQTLQWVRQLVQEKTAPADKECAGEDCASEASAAEDCADQGYVHSNPK